MKLFATFVLFALVFAGCTSSSSKCAYSSVTMKALINNRTIDEKQISGCFIVQKGSGGTIEVSLKDSSDRFSMHYAVEEEEKDSVSSRQYIPHLDVKTNGSLSAWTQDKGHIIYSQKKDNALAFSFSDDTLKDNRVSGILIFRE